MFPSQYFWTKPIIKSNLTYNSTESQYIVIVRFTEEVEQFSGNTWLLYTFASSSLLAEVSSPSSRRLLICHLGGTIYLHSHSLTHTPVTCHITIYPNYRNSEPKELPTVHSPFVIIVVSRNWSQQSVLDGYQKYGFSRQQSLINGSKVRRRGVALHGTGYSASDKSISIAKLYRYHQLSEVWTNARNLSPLWKFILHIEWFVRFYTLFCLQLQCLHYKLEPKQCHRR
jgi:hypothetical protein